MRHTTYLFDFDYTLADSSKGIVICFQNVLKNHGYNNVTDEEVKRTIGKTLEDSFSILTGELNMEILQKYKKLYEQEANQYMNINTFLYPETLTVLQTLKKNGAKLGIISTKYRYRIKDLLSNYLPDDFFDIIVGGEDVTEHKPSPQGLLIAMKQLQVDKSDVLYIGDSVVDAEAAQQAQVDFAGVLHGMTTKEELEGYPHLLIMNDLTPLISKEKKSDRFRKIKLYYRWLRIKQVNGFQTKSPNKEETVCKNCGETYTGNYCNRCGQDKNTARLRFSNILQNALNGFSSMDRGFGLTLLELIFRPGYLIYDYLKGKRIRYFRPFQMLFILSAVYILWAQFIDPTAIKTNKETKDKIEEVNDSISNEQYNDKTEAKFVEIQNNQLADSTSLNKHYPDTKTSKILEKVNKTKRLGYLGEIMNMVSKWLNQNKALSILMILPIFALATRWAFKKQKSETNYNFTELLFAQTYIACQILLLSIIILAFSHKAKVSDIFDIPEWAIFALYLLDYKQLFRKSWLSTLGRTILMFIYSLVIILIFAIIIASTLIGGIIMDI